MTRQQLAYYRETNEGFYKKALTSAGIKLSFKTDSASLKLDLTLQPVMARTYAAVEVYVNGARIDSIHNFEGEVLSGNYAEQTYPCGRYDKTFRLGCGEKEVCVYFPRLINTIIHSVVLDAGAFCLPVKPEKKALVFGDSITQGFDCLWPTSHYVEQFRNNCRGFYENLHKNYPGVPVIAITPIWRANMEAVRDSVCFGTIHEIEEYVRQVTAGYDNITVIRGFELIPHEPGYFGDLFLHPSDEGFAHYGKNLIRSLRDCGFLRV